MELNQPTEDWATPELLGQWLALRAKVKPTLGEYIWAACQGTDVNPLVMAAIGFVKSKGFTLCGDTFACDVSGKLEKQIIDSAQRYQYMVFDELKLSQQQCFSAENAYDGMVTWMRSSLVDSGTVVNKTTSHPSEPEPTPGETKESQQPTPPQAEPSVPEPVVPSLPPGRWTCRECHFSNGENALKCAKCGDMRPELQQWWICRRCEQVNPPLGKTCLKCHATKGGIVILPPDPAPKPPRVELPGGGTVPLWLVRLRGIVNTLSAAFVLVQFLVPKPVAVVVRAVLSALKLILNQVWRSINEGNNRSYRWANLVGKRSLGACKRWFAGK